MNNKLKTVIILISIAVLLVITIFLIVFLFKGNNVDTEKLGLIIATVLGAIGFPAVLSTILSKKSIEPDKDKEKEENN